MGVDYLIKLDFRSDPSIDTSVSTSSYSSLSLQPIVTFTCPQINVMSMLSKLFFIENEPSINDIFILSNTFEI